jgi:hypothetical protein
MSRVLLLSFIFYLSLPLKKNTAARSPPLTSLAAGRSGSQAIPQDTPMPVIAPPPLVPAQGSAEEGDYAWRKTGSTKHR